MIQGRRDLRSLAQTPAPSRVRCEIRAGCLRLHLVWGLEIMKNGGCKTCLSNQPAPSHDCPPGKKGFPCTQTEPLFFQCMPDFSSPPTMHHCEKPDSKSCHPRPPWLWSMHSPSLLMLDCPALYHIQCCALASA